MLGIFKEGIDKECKKYIEDITDIVSEKIAQLLYSIEKLSIFISNSEIFGLSFNRRLVMKDGKMRMNWEGVDPQSVLREAGPIDPELYVISLRDCKGSTKALIINFTLYPAVLVGKDWLYSRDYLNYLDGYIKDKIGADTVVFFANGAQGNINHIDYKDKNQGRGFEEAKRIGNILGKEVLKLLEQVQPVRDEIIKCEHQTIA